MPVPRQDYLDAAPRLAPVPPAAARDSVSLTLRRERAAHGQSVRTIAQVLRIRQGYIEALESGTFDQLPGTTDALGFLRTYAEYLGLDGDEMVDRFKAEVGGAEQRAELVFPEPVVEGRIPGGAVILISVALLGAAYGGWFYLSNQGRSVSSLIPAMPSQLRALVEPAEEPPAETAPVPATATPVVEAPAPAPEATPETVPAP
ncbi:MAG: helix-turn-helix domain-containing protein, partial [Kiloniellaceae bacterium]